jgi:hypothetical protein
LIFAAVLGVEFHPVEGFGLGVGEHGRGRLAEEDGQDELGVGLIGVAGGGDYGEVNLAIEIAHSRGAARG